MPPTRDAVVRHPVPNQLGTRVSVREGSLTFHADGQGQVKRALNTGMLSGLFGFLVLWAHGILLAVALETQLGPIALAGVLLFSGISTLATGLACLIAVGIAALPWEQRTVSAGRVRGLFGTRLRWTAPEPPVAPLVLQGKPGWPVHLWMGDFLLQTFRPDPMTWSVDAISWAAERSAATLGVDLEDHREEAAWRRWEADPRYRAQVAFDRRLQQNHREFGDRHGVPPVEPTWTELDHQGLRWHHDHGLFRRTEVAVTTTHLHYGDEACPLAYLSRVAVFVTRNQTDGGDVFTGTVEVLLGTQTLVVYTERLRTLGSIASLHGLADAIGEAARRASRPSDPGTEAEVPLGLRSLRVDAARVG